jgi:hypothetical protein
MIQRVGAIEPTMATPFSVIRLWQLPVAHLLRGGLAVLPLALLCDLPGTSPEEVVTRLESRIEREAQIEERRKLWASTYLLAGVRYAPEIAGKLLERAGALLLLINGGPGCYDYLAPVSQLIEDRCRELAHTAA